MKKIFFLINHLDEFDFYEFVKKHLTDMNVSVGDSLPSHIEEYDLIILWSYRKIIPNISNRKNIIIFHSSDLPDGKGWAPIYYSISKGLEYYTISGILPSDEVDSGDIIVKARFKMKDNYTAEIIRRWDQEISIILITKILEKFNGKEIRGKKQEGVGSFYPKRKPVDNEIDVKSSISDILLHLRACERQHPPFFVYNKTKYFITLEPEIIPDFPNDLEITFFDSSQ